MDSEDIRKCSLTFLCRDLFSVESSSCAALINCLCSLGHTVSVITETRPTDKDFRCDHRIKRFSFDSPIRFSNSRKGILQDFAKKCDQSLFIVFTSSTQTMCDDIFTLTNSGYKVTVIEDIPLITFLYDGSTALYKRSLDALSASSAVISLSESALLHLRENGITNTCLLPYFFPFTNGEFPEPAVPDSIAVIFNTTTVPIEKLSQKLNSISKEYPDCLILIRGLKHSSLETNHNIFFTKDSYSSLVDKCRAVILVSDIPFISRKAVDLNARRIPYAFISAYSDSSIRAFDVSDICVPTEKPSFSESDQAVLCSKYSAFFQSVINGNSNAEQTENINFDKSSLLPFLEQLRQKNNFYTFNPKSTNGDSKRKDLLSVPKSFWNFLEAKRYSKYTVHQSSQETVRKCQLLALHMLNEFERICKKHSLRYYIAAGSLLGAVRHNGLIPWDDDIDVTMPRPDYEAFLKIAQKELPHDMIMPKCNFPYGFSRIQIKDTAVNRMIKQRGPHGVFLDILPLDGAAPDELSAKAHDRKNERLLGLMLLKSLPIPVLSLNFKSLKLLIQRLFLKCIPKRLFMHLWKKNATLYSTGDAKSWICLPGIYGYKKECFPKEFWGEGCQILYEGTPRPVMKEWNTYLTLHYGDYNRFPPKLHRRTHSSCSIDLGKYSEISIDTLEETLNLKRKDVVTDQTGQIL